MEKRKSCIITFSPTCTSAKVAAAVARGLQCEHVSEMDLTCHQLNEAVTVSADSIAVISVPVYAGRVAPLAVQRLKQVHGEHTPAVLLTVYGNRDYEDALVELRDLMQSQGFVPLAAAAFVGEHSYSRPGMPVAEGRPDADDLQKAEDFGRRCAEKYMALTDADKLEAFYIKGNVPYRVVGPSTPQAPVWNEELCTSCGTCIDVCPTASIRMDENSEVHTEPATCIKCCACVKACPAGALVFDTPYTAMLHTKFSARREPETFI